MLIKITLAFSMSLILTSCTSPAIKYDNKNTLSITLNEKIITKGTGSIAYENRVNLSNINIYQKVFVLDSGMIVTYEDAYVSSGYKFSYGVNRTIGIVFPNYSYKLVSMQGNLHFYELSTDTTKIYLIVQNMNAKGLRLVYGMDKNIFKKIQRAVKADKSIKASPRLNTSELKTISDTVARGYIKSDWNMKNIILDTIISKINSGKAIK